MEWHFQYNKIGKPPTDHTHFYIIFKSLFSPPKLNLDFEETQNSTKVNTEGEFDKLLLSILN